MTASPDYNMPVLVVDPEPAARTALLEMLSSYGQSVDTAPDGVSAAELLGRKSYKLVLAEADLPKKNGLSLLGDIQRRFEATPVVLLSDTGDVRQAVEAIRMGAMDYLIKPVTADMIEEILSRLAELNRAAARLQAQSDGEAGAGAKLVRPIITRSPEMERLLEMARSVADSQATVLISGESGTGKELFARYIHANSIRAGGPFVAVNCAALPENLLESELFGHEKGAFTGAIARKPGKFELADGGTLLLDEISEMNLALQAKLLRVLQEGEVDRLGGKTPVPVNVRVVATTNRDLEAAVEKGDFREDLFYRLNVIPLRLPPLRERPEDIQPLAEHFIDKYSRRDNKVGIGLARETIKALNEHSWRGNVRELENVIERAVLLCRTDKIQVADLMLDIKPNRPAAKPSTIVYNGQTIKEMEQSMIEAALGHTDGNRTHAAKLLGISVRTLRNKLNEYKAQAASSGSNAGSGRAAAGG